MPKRKKKKKVENSDEVLDDVLGMSPGREEAAAAQDDEPEEDKTPVEESPPSPDSGEAEDETTAEEDGASDVPEEDSSSADPESDAQDEPEDDGDDDGEPNEVTPEDEDEEEDPEAIAAAEADPEKRAEGLLAALAKARKKNAELQIELNRQAPVMQPPPPPQGPQQQQPVPPPPGETTAQSPNIGRIPVIVDPETQEVFVDPAVQEEILGTLVEQRVQQALTPTPEQLAMEEARREHNKLVEDYPEAATRVNNADEYLSERLRGFLAQGYRPQNINDVTDLFRQQGVEVELMQHMPELGTAISFDELVQVVSVNQPSWKRSVVERVNKAIAAPSTPNIPTPKPSLSPPSMAKKGGSRTPDTRNTSDLREFQELEKEFMEQTVHQSKERYERLKQLGQQLDIEGY